MKKIGILTLFYKNYNYGGILQAYALQEYLKKCGYDAEQIKFEKKSYICNKQRFKNLIEETNLFFAINKLMKKYISNVMNKVFPIGQKKLGKILIERNEKFEEFSKECISSSARIYDDFNINEVNELYDVFVCGSDQIWKPGVVCDAYTLNFVKSKPKISYAASISRKNISKYDLNYLESTIKKLDYISVRESQAKDILSKLISNKISVVVDPTLLLEAEDYEKLVSERIVGEKYVFYYFLTLNKKVLNFLIKKYKKENVKIVLIPALDNRYHICEYKNNIYCLNNIGPREFLSLIKFAECIYTDSFHASLFSCLFSKKFYSFNRLNEKSMNSRILELLETFGCLARYIDNSKKISRKITSIEKMNFENINNYENVTTRSKNFLKNSIEGCGIKNG